MFARLICYWLGLYQQAKLFQCTRSKGETGVQSWLEPSYTVSFRPYVRHMLCVTQTFWQVWCSMVNILHYTSCSCPMGHRPEIFYAYIHLIYTILGCVTVNYMSDPLHYTLFFLKSPCPKTFCYRYVDIWLKRCSMCMKVNFKIQELKQEGT